MNTYDRAKREIFLCALFYPFILYNGKAQQDYRTMNVASQQLFNSSIGFCSKKLRLYTNTFPYICALQAVSSVQTEE